jgi:signal transduction histidine kinase
MRSFLPLRLKLTLWSVLVFVVTLLMLYLGVWVFARTRSSLDVEGELHAKLATAIARLKEPEAVLQNQAEIDRIARGLSSSPLSRRYSIRLWTEDGTLYSSSGDDDSLRNVPFARTEDATEVRVDKRRVPLADGDELNLRVATREFTASDGRQLYAELATPAAAAEEDVIALRRFALYILPFGVLAAAVAAWIMAGRVVSPIRRLAKAARAVSPASLEGPIDVEPADQEIARLQHELNDAFGRLEKAYREQGSFISNVSHELKTPIAVLLSQAQVLKQEERSPLEYRRFLAVVEDEMRSLGRLVESFLVLARVGHGKELVRRDRATVNDVVLEAAEHCAPLSRHHEVPLVTLLHLSDDGEPEPEIEGDPELLRTMFENLLRNALRFSPSGEPVDLRVSCTRDRASILVRDRGPGIAPEHIDRVFERFYTVTDAEVSGRGSGLGLAIAKSIAELHNGTISVHNCVDRGCEFEVLLPLSKPVPLAEVAAEPEPPPAGTANAPQVAAESELPAREITPKSPPSAPPRLEGLPATE